MTFLASESHQEPFVIVRKKKGTKYSKYRWKQLGFSSSRKNQEFLQQFKKESCELCGMDRRLHSYAFGYDITIHHIDGNKFNNHPFNLQTLCALCHTQVDDSFHLHYHRMLRKRTKKIRKK